jgi:hypothetical protein
LRAANLDRLNAAGRQVVGANSTVERLERCGEFASDRTIPNAFLVVTFSLEMCSVGF